MRRAVGLSPEAGKRSNRQMQPGDPHHPEASGSRWLSPPIPLESWGCRTWRCEVAQEHRQVHRRVIFEDEVMPPGRPLGRVPAAKDGQKPRARSVPSALSPRPRALPDYVVRYPAIQSRRQREGYKGVFQDQLAEYTELLGEVRAVRHRLGELQATMGRSSWHTPAQADGSRVANSWHEYVRKKRDSAFVEKQQRCEYLKKKLTHIKARIQEYDRDCAGCSRACAPAGTGGR